MLTFYFWLPIEERACRKTRLGGVCILLHSPLCSYNPYNFRVYRNKSVQSFWPPCIYKNKCRGKCKKIWLINQCHNVALKSICSAALKIHRQQVLKNSKIKTRLSPYLVICFWLNAMAYSATTVLPAEVCAATNTLSA